MSPLGGRLLAPRRERLEIKQLNLPQCTGRTLLEGFNYPVHNASNDAVETPRVRAPCGTVGAQRGLAELRTMLGLGVGWGAGDTSHREAVSQAKPKFSLAQQTLSSPKSSCLSLGT